MINYQDFRDGYEFLLVLSIRSISGGGNVVAPGSNISRLAQKYKTSKSQILIIYCVNALWTILAISALVWLMWLSRDQAFLVYALGGLLFVLIIWIIPTLSVKHYKKAGKLKA